tara:strand:- start:966 stop:2123 length:1158 start_codon:yes stop_codon:yes gene_type:complete
VTDAYALSRQSVDKIKQDLERLRTQVANLDHGRLRAAHKAPQRDDYLVAKAGGTVAARSGSTLTSGIFTIQDVSNTGALSDSARTETAWNLGTTAITSGEFVPIERDYRTGRWIARAPGGGTSVNIAYVIAVENWQYSTTFPSAGGGMAWVSVKKVDRDGTGSTGSAFDCWLPVPPHMDPNVIEDQVFCAAEFADQSDGETSWAAISDVSDLAVGSVKMMTGNTPTAAQGWVPLDGNQDTTKTADGNAVDMDGRSPLATAVGTHGGDLNPSDQTSAEEVSINITGSSVTTGSSETGIEGTSSEPAGSITVTTEELMHDSGGPDTTTVVTDVTDDGFEHAHELADPGHTHAVSGTFTGTADSHRHDIELHPWCGIYFYERIDNSGV